MIAHGNAHGVRIVRQCHLDGLARVAVKQGIAHNVVDCRVEHVRFAGHLHRVVGSQAQPARRALALELGVVDDLAHQLCDVERFEGERGRITLEARVFENVADQLVEAV